MSIFTVVETFMGPSDLHVTGITDLQIVWVDDTGTLSAPGVGARRLISSAIQDGGLMSLALTEDGLSLIDDIAPLSSEYSLSAPLRVEMLNLDGTPFVARFGLNETTLSGYRLDNTGAFQAAVTYDSDAALGAVAALEVITHPEGKTLMFTSDVTGTGLSCWHVTPTGALAYIGTLPTPSASMTTLPDLAQAQIDGQPYLLAVSAADNALISYAVNSDGTLTQVAQWVIVHFSDVAGGGWGIGHGGSCDR